MAVRNQILPIIGSLLAMKRSTAQRQQRTVLRSTMKLTFCHRPAYGSKPMGDILEHVADKSKDGNVETCIIMYVVNRAPSFERVVGNGKTKSCRESANLPPCSAHLMAHYALRRVLKPSCAKVGSNQKKKKKNSLREPAVSAYPTPCQTRTMYKNQKYQKALEKANTPNLIAHHRRMRTTFLHKNALLDTLLLNLVHPILFFFFLQYPPAEHFLQPALLLALLRFDCIGRDRMVWSICADLA